jgi:hypothetical protein
MATLIPSFNSCSMRMTPGERRLAQRLEEKLENDYLQKKGTGNREQGTECVLFFVRVKL